MVLCVRVRKEDAERVRRELIRLCAINFDYSPFASEEYVYFPVKNEVNGYEIEEREFERSKKQPRSLKEGLKGILTEEEINSLITSFDVIGDIAIIEIPKSLKGKESIIANTLLKIHRNIKVVLRKSGEVEGVFRVRKLDIIGGEKRTETIHKESGCRFKLDVQKVYFSPRLIYERKRIAELVKPYETILVMFAGVGPFPIIIGKKNPSTKIYAIELNPIAFNYLKENILLNKTENIIPIYGDVREVIPKMFINMADRVLLPLPKGAEEFLKEAFLAGKKNCIFHFYSFVSRERAFKEVEEKIYEVAERNGKKIKIINKRVVRPYSPSTLQVVVDFKT